jgi:phage baseplate assembly protein W
MINDIRINPLDLDPDVAIGVTLPFYSSKGKAFNLSYTTIEQAKTNLRSLLLTNEGERYMQPTFGCNLRKIVFDPITPELPDKIKKIINEKVSYWLPYIEISTLNVVVEEDLNYVNFEIQFNLLDNKYDNASITFNIELP